MREDFEHAPDGSTAVLADITALDICPSRYVAHIDHFDMTEAQKHELLRCLLTIVRGFVELGFTGNICEQIFEGSGSPSRLSPHTIESLPDDKGSEG